MTKENFIYMVIEGIVCLIPIITLIIKFGKLMGRIENMEEKMKDLPEWKVKTDEKVTRLEVESTTMSTNLQNINNTLIKISTQVGLLLENRIKDCD